MTEQSQPSPKITAPFTPEQVDALNAYQQSGLMHPFTCPKHSDGEHVLIARTEGWFCKSIYDLAISTWEVCTYTQNWAWAGMADPVFLAEREAAINEMVRKTSTEGMRFFDETVDLSGPSDEDRIYEKVPVEDFPWPCERREAHGPHPQSCDCAHVERGLPYHTSECGSVAMPPCSGVGAHPATMAGTIYRLRTS